MSAESTIRRVVVIGVLVALLVVAAIVDDPSSARTPVRLPDEVATLQVGADPLARPSETALGHAMPVAPVGSAASSTWFCGGGAAQEGSVRDTTLVVTNRGARTSQARVTVRDARGASKVKSLSVPGATSVTLPLRDVLEAPWAAAIVEASGGGVVVSQRIGTDATVTMSACATSSSESWYFPNGSTDRGAAERLVLFNPFDDLVTADIAFLTDEGFRQPQSVHGIPVSPGSVAVVNVADVENRKVDLASTVTTRAGRLIVWRTQTFDGSGPDLDAGFPPNGVSVALGSSTGLTSFVLPTAVTGEGVATRVAIANPGTEMSNVELLLAPDDPAVNGQPPKLDVKVAAGTVLVLGADKLRQVPEGVPFTVHGRVTSGGPVVAELWLDGTEPAKGRGAFATPAIPVAAKSWLVTRGFGKLDIDQLGVFRTGPRATLTFTVIDKGVRTKLSGAKVPTAVEPDGRVSMDLATVLKDHPGAAVLVEASAPVTVSRLQAGSDAKGLVSFPSVPINGRFATP